MVHKLFWVVVAAWSLSGVAGEPARAEPPFRVTAVEKVKLAERGAILAEDFEGPRLDRARWRVWQQNADQTNVRQEHGRLVLEGQGLLGHNGLWGLVTAKYKDVVLVGEMDIRSQGSAPHRLALHLCGGDDARSPDHWVEIDLVDLGENARFSAMAALPHGFARHEDKFLELPHPADQGFLCRLSLDGATNLVELDVKSGDTWRSVCPPIELPLRTVHTEIKLHGNHGWPGPEQAAGSSSRAWFDNVRIYPRPESHHVGVRLVRPDGGPIWLREDDGWPPQIVDGQGKSRSIEELEVQLWTADGETRVAAVRSANMGFYLLPLKNAPWDVYPVAAEFRVVLDGKPLGPPLRVESQAVGGLYPDDVYNIVVAQRGEEHRVAALDGDIFLPAGYFTRVQDQFVPIATDDRHALPGPFNLLDLDGDGQPEVVFVMLGYPKCDPQPVQVLRLVSGKLQRDDQLWNGSPPAVRHSTQISQVDFNQDGQLDLVISDAGLDYPPFSGSRLALFYGDRGKYTDQSDLLPKQVWTARSYALGVGVLNPADGPVLLYPRQSSDAAHGLVKQMDGQLVFESEWIDEQRKYLVHAECARLADFDGDGKTDVYLGGNAYSPGNTVFWGTGESTLRNSVTGQLPSAPFGFTPWEEIRKSTEAFVVGGNAGPVAIIDVDQDGLLDIVAIWERVHTYQSGKARAEPGSWVNGPSAYLDEQLQVLRNNGDRSFTDISDRTAGRNFGRVYFRCVIPMDVNLDGHIDLIGPYTDKETRTFGTLLMLNDGSGRFEMVDARELVGDAAHENPGSGRKEVGAFLPIQITPAGITAALVSPVSGPRGTFGYQFSTVVAEGPVAADLARRRAAAPR